ncbi:hypothetical protein JOE63_004060 [Cellulosimicrobium cellulans]|uniref:DUF6194 family protein n=1 Tax=Cellulosimicrobium cellulans TaxID=1710 RepID=UPI00195D34F6|nr:DUF6194 family protein [Cellulosimicrobium cellulans]MBM7821583.1 hypothetical protein [Cellulosimicrobium cellulans]
MSMEQILDTVRSLDGVLVLSPGPGSEFPELAWGDHFFYHAPDGVVPHGQPYGTVVTKDYPDDTTSRLDDEGRWRVNVHVGRDRFRDLVGSDPRDEAPSEAGETDVVVPHPVYGALGWVCVVNPGERTTPLVLDLLRAAHDDARARAARRAAR